MKNYLSLWYHLVWSTKNRNPLIDKAWKWQLYSRMKDFCTEKEYHLDFVNGVEDHIHLLISPKPKFALSDVVRDIKRDSYYWILDNKKCDEVFTWQDGYGALTVSPSQVEKVRNYIRNQEEHHKVHTFEREIEKFQFATEKNK